MEQKHPIEVTVKYVGKHDFRIVLHDDPTFLELKVAAMDKFELELGSASKYVLQYKNADLSDKEHVSSLRERTVVLLLTLKKEPVKG